MMLIISRLVSIPRAEIEMHAIRSRGAGGQNVNKVSTAIHLRFDISTSSLPDCYKERLLALRDHRITKEGIVIIKSQSSRSQEFNRKAALERLFSLIQQTMFVEKKRKATKPSYSAKQKRINKKTQRGQLKNNRGKVTF